MCNIFSNNYFISYTHRTCISFSEYKNSFFKHDILGNLLLTGTNLVKYLTLLKFAKLVPTNNSTLMYSVNSYCMYNPCSMYSDDILASAIVCS